MRGKGMLLESNQIYLHQIQNKMLAQIKKHDVENRFTVVETTYGTELVLPLRHDLPTGLSITVAVSAHEISLSHQYLSGISIQNQIKGRICAVIPNENGMLIQIDCGNTWLAGISLKAYRDMKLQEGLQIYCLAKMQAFSYGSVNISERFKPLFKHRKPSQLPQINPH
jgi:molybdate transport system ATP-binding protein